MQLWILFKGSEHLRITRKALRLHGETMLQIVRTSLGGIGQMVVAMTAWIFLMRVLAVVSTEAVAGATIAMRIMMFTLMPAWGMSNAAATLVGPNPGAGAAGARRGSCMAHRLDEHGFHARGIRRILRRARRRHRPVHIGLGHHRDRWRMAIDPGVLVLRVRLVDGLGASVQRCRRHHDPDLDQSGVLLADPDPARRVLAVPMGWAHSGVFWAVFVSETGVGLFTLWLFSRGRWKTTSV